MFSIHAGLVRLPILLTALALLVGCPTGDDDDTVLDDDDTTPGDDDDATFGDDDDITFAY